MPSSCHSSSPLEYRAVPHDAASPLTIALAGNPNSGKTTLFNALTGLRQKVANYPGVTVEKKTGKCKLNDGRWIDVIDLPGTYSLISRSPDEQVAMEVLRGLRRDTRPPDVVVVVVDASNLQRNLYLVSQLIELGRPMVIALNMTDVAQRRGIIVRPEVLAQELGVPVVPLVGHKRKGVSDLKNAIGRAAVAPLPAWPLPDAMREELLIVAGGLAILESEEASTDGKKALPIPETARPLDRYEAIAERLLIGDHANDVAPLISRPSINALLKSAMDRLAHRGIDPMQADIEAHYRWIDGVFHKAVTEKNNTPGEVSTPPGGVIPYAQPKTHPTASDKVDAVLIHKVWGLVIFSVVMAGLFVSIFWLATPIMDAIKEGIKALGGWATGSLAEGPIKSLLLDGVFNGVGSVVVFVPQIAMLFFFLAILEDSGYLARAAFLMDRLLSKVGLSGKSFIPLLSSFACAIPGIMATRTIENRRDRLATIFIAPFMSCSARLPVYALLISAFFASSGAIAKGGILLACYSLGIIAAVITAWFFKRSFLKGPPQAFILELPTYKLPQASQVARVVWSNTSKFLTKAGTVIFCLSVILWAMSYYPRLSAEQTAAIKTRLEADPFKRWDPDLYDSVKPPTKDEVLVKAFSAAQSEYSISGRIGHFIEPAIKPLGFNWKMGVGLVSAFAAREVFVSSLGIVYSVGDVEDDTADLAQQMKSDLYPDGRNVWTPLVAVSLLVWFVLAMQCMSTLAIVRRETGGWKWPIVMLVYMNGLAYAACLLVYQVGRIWLA